MRVIFISFQDNTDIIGVKYLHAYITLKGYESSILLIPNNKSSDIKAAIDYIVMSKPDVLCFSAMSYEFKMAKNFADVLKKRFNNCPVIFGGIHATAEPESCLDVSDIVVRGEGEETLLELLQVLNSNEPDNIAHVAGIIFKQRNRVVYTNNRQPVQYLDTLPYPRLFPDSMYVVHKGNIHSIKKSDMYRRYARYQGTFLSIASSRGCPFSCSYCSNSMLKSLYGKNILRSRSVQSVIKEIVEEIRDFANILYVRFTDDCFMMHPMEWTVNFSEQYAKKVNIPFVAGTTPKHIDRDKLYLLRKAGLRWIFMGLQTGSDRINREVYSRFTTSEDFLKGAQIISELKISPWYDVILDNPYETEEDSLKTIDVLLRTARPFQISLFSLDFFPGTELLRGVIKDNIPIPKIGTKSYTEPEPRMINRYIRMCATLPSGLVRLLVHMRRSIPGKIIGICFYGLSLLLEPFMYVRLIYRSNDLSFIRTIKVVRAFYTRSINKLLLRKIA